MKKVLLSVLSLALVAAISIGATLAYLQDDDSDVNVMTLGNVYIEQIEQQRVDDNANQTTLEEFGLLLLMDLQFLIQLEMNQTIPHQKSSLKIFL